MNIIDILIIIVLIIGAALGFKNGFIKTVTSFVGTFAIIIVAFMLKGSLSQLLYENLPFFGFFGAIKGIQVLNIVFYEVVAFLIVFGVLQFLLHIVLVATGLFEKIIKMTVILSLPSKLLGAVVGVLQYFVYIFIALFIFSFPIFHIDEIGESKYGSRILDETPVLSDLSKESISLYDKVYMVVKNRDKKSNEQLNKEMLEVMLENKFITYESAKGLVDANKIYLDDKEFLEKYK